MGEEELGCSRWSFTRIHKLRLHPLHIGYIRYISVTSVTSVTCRLHPLHPLHYMSVTKVEFPGRRTLIMGVEELGCSRWSFTRIMGEEELGCSRWSFTRIALTVGTGL